jgi:hypothetical protein
MLLAGLSNSIFASGGLIVIRDTIGELGFGGAVPSNYDQSGDDFYLEGNARAGASDKKHRSQTGCGVFTLKWRGQDSKLRPPGYELES